MGEGVGVLIVAVSAFGLATHRGGVREIPKWAELHAGVGGRMGKVAAGACALAAESQRVRVGRTAADQHAGRGVSEGVCEEDGAAVLKAFAFAVVGEVAGGTARDAALSGRVCELVVGRGAKQHAGETVGLCVVGHRVGRAGAQTFEVLWVAVGA
jgi:hypothetical protein